MHAANPVDRWQTGLEDSPLSTRGTSKASGLQNSSDEQSATEALSEFWDIPTDSVVALCSSVLSRFHLKGS